MIFIQFLPGLLALVGLIAGKGFVRLLAVILIPIAILLALLGSMSLRVAFDPSQPWNAIHSKEFMEMHSLILERDLNTVAIHLEDTFSDEPEFVIIDEIAFSPAAQTYGDMSRLPAFDSLVEAGSVHRFESLSELFKQQGIDLSVRSFNQTIKLMKKLGIHKFIKDPESGIIVYAWTTWALIDAQGVVYVPSGNIPTTVGKNFEGRDIWRLNEFFFGWRSREGFFWQEAESS